MTTKRFKKPELEMTVDPVDVEPTMPATVELLLDDFVAMNKAVELASVGFSMSSIASSLQIPVPTFISWIKKGKANEEVSPRMPEVILWKELSKGWAVAKGLAESKLASVDPKFFLTRGPARLLGDDWDEDVSGNANEEKETLDITEDFITALKRLRERGHDLNEIIDNNLLSVKVEHEDKPVDLLEKHGITQVHKGLPGPLAQKTAELDQILNLERNIDG
jgi:hypothetical protein